VIHADPASELPNSSVLEIKSQTFKVFIRRYNFSWNEYKYEIGMIEIFLIIITLKSYIKTHQQGKEMSHMKIISKQIILLIVIVSFMSGIAFADNYSKTIEIYKKSPSVQPFFKNAYGYAVFPTIGKGGLVIGAAYGKGLVYQGGKVMGETELLKATIGFQLGGQAFSEMIFFEDKRAYDDFTSENFEFDATASAVAITAGVQATTGTEGSSENSEKYEQLLRNHFNG